VRANPTAALASRNLGWRLPEIRVVKRRAAASVTTTLEKLSVHVEYGSRPRPLVKVVHVLGAAEKAVLQYAFEFGEGKVRRIWFGCRSNPPTHGIELPHQLGIAVPSKG